MTGERYRIEADGIVVVLDFVPVHTRVQVVWSAAEGKWVRRQVGRFWRPVTTVADASRPARSMLVRCECGSVRYRFVPRCENHRCEKAQAAA